MSTSAIQAANSPVAAAPRTATHEHGWSFHDILSALNPLQYLPVVGTIYRALTGDVISEPLRRAGSLVVSGLLGGPIGLITSIVTTLAEKITGIEPEKIISAQFNRGAPAAVAADVVPAAISAAVISLNSAASTSLAMTPAQLAAYGVTTDASGTLRLGDIRGADVLNTIEQGRHARAAAAYAANQ
jgi:hypothetical protein